MTHNSKEGNMNEDDEASDRLESVKRRLKGHPKADVAFRIAWDWGHSNGRDEVAHYLDELADLLDCPEKPA